MGLGGVQAAAEQGQSVLQTSDYSGLLFTDTCIGLGVLVIHGQAYVLTNDLWLHQMHHCPVGRQPRRLYYFALALPLPFRLSHTMT